MIARDKQPFYEVEDREYVRKTAPFSYFPNYLNWQQEEKNRRHPQGHSQVASFAGANDLNRQDYVSARANYHPYKSKEVRQRPQLASRGQFRYGQLAPIDSEPPSLAKRDD
ncbi:hypothetical protein AWM75_06180 [Aerococcus urinaehominis]|uniref:Uncharacterized protein n=1 Tax=Aerococcus urinaehominis TaxID=128944 RepID=A0A0X8FMW0_9LACT|nr:hypothetical protein [Aerococcus urinaehominis]AMB99592.1 hypothetical protein AWM75_06180 [Aerococcus urinaehominis]SDL86713.1 hypothetical protein SAMN04487985_10234 [Aerococcus urinaehominis]